LGYRLVIFDSYPNKFTVIACGKRVKMRKPDITVKVNFMPIQWPGIKGVHVMEPVR